MAKVDFLTLKYAEAGPDSVASAIAADGTDPISKGEVVLALEADTATMMTLDAEGTPRIIAQGGTAPVGPGSVRKTLTWDPPDQNVSDYLTDVGVTGLITSVACNQAARITIYESLDGMSADGSRTVLVTPRPESKVAAELVTTQSELIDAPPGVTYRVDDPSAGLLIRLQLPNQPSPQGPPLTVTVELCVLER